MKTLFSTLAIFFASLAFAQEQANPNLIIDLTEKQAFERYKNSNVRKAVGLKIKDFNYQELIKSALYTDRISEIIILNNTNDKKIIKLVKTAQNLSNTTMPNGLPLCDDCSMTIFQSEKQIKDFEFRGINYAFLK